MHKKLATSIWYTAVLLRVCYNCKNKSRWHSICIGSRCMHCKDETFNGDKVNTIRIEYFDFNIFECLNARRDNYVILSKLFATKKLRMQYYRPHFYVYLCVFNASIIHLQFYAYHISSFILHPVLLQPRNLQRKYSQLLTK